MSPLVPLRGRTLGIVGLGRIGRSLAARAAGLKLRVLAHDVLADHAAAARLGVELVDFDTLLAQSDFVSIHVPSTPETRGMFNHAAFAKMRPGSFLVNTARGEIIVESDLADALRNGHLAGAGLDVFVEEPPPADHPLLALDNVIVSPHVSSSDTQATEDMANAAAKNIVDLSRGDWPADSIINPAVKERWAGRR